MMMPMRESPCPSGVHVLPNTLLNCISWWKSCLFLLSGLLILPSSAIAAEEFDSFGLVTVLPADPGDHWVWFAGGGRASLMDAGSAKYLGNIAVGGQALPAFSPDGRFIYMPETFWTRGTRGTRTDIVTVFDASTLLPVDEIAIPAKRVQMLSPIGAVELTDDGRFLAVYNLTPATSLSIIDMTARSLTGEYDIPGCSLVYGAGDRRFVSLCSNGAVLTLSIDDEGRELSKVRQEGFLDPELDPVTERAVRYHDEWLFVSYAGIIHPLDIGDDETAFNQRWSLFTPEDRAESWHIAGTQHLAVDRGTGELFALVHQIESQDEPISHDGTEVWVYDIAEQRRTRRIPLQYPATEVDASAGGYKAIEITSGEQPLLLASRAGSGPGPGGGAPEVLVFLARDGSFKDTIKSPPPGALFVPRSGR